MLDRELVEAVKLAREAGKILLEVYGGADFGVEMKGESDPVTDADRRANAFLVSRLHDAFPGDTIIAEESAHEARRSNGRCWFVDPLDGTKEFIAKNGEFSVMIGLAIDGEAQLGVVFQPTRKKLWRGVVGDSAFLETGDKTYVLRTSEIASPSDMRLVVSRSHRSKSTDDLVRKLGITKEQASGSVGLKVGLIAEREADLYVHLSDRSSVWDACGPEAVLRAAGGMFTDLEGKQLVYGGEELRNKRGLLACNRRGFDHVVEAVAEVARAAGLID